MASLSQTPSLSAGLFYLPSVSRLGGQEGVTASADGNVTVSPSPHNAPSSHGRHEREACSVPFSQHLCFPSGPLRGGGRCRPGPVSTIVRAVLPALSVGGLLWGERGERAGLPACPSPTAVSSWSRHAGPSTDLLLHLFQNQKPKLTGRGCPSLCVHPHTYMLKSQSPGLRTGLFLEVIRVNEARRAAPTCYSWGPCT